MAWVSAILAILYGLMTIAGGAASFKTEQIQKWASGCMVLFGVVLVCASIGQLLDYANALLFMIISLIGIHVVTINNAMQLHGKLTLSHHVVRFLISVIIVATAVL